MTNWDLSVSVKRCRGTIGTFKVPFAGRKYPKKLSEPLITTPNGVTTPVSLEHP
jgi:hypothetical protein